MFGRSSSRHLSELLAGAWDPAMKHTPRAHAATACQEFIKGAGDEPQKEMKPALPEPGTCSMCREHWCEPAGCLVSLSPCLCLCVPKQHPNSIWRSTHVSSLALSLSRQRGEENSNWKGGRAVGSTSRLSQRLRTPLSLSFTGVLGPKRGKKLFKSANCGQLWAVRQDNMPVHRQGLSTRQNPPRP